MRPSKFFIQAFLKGNNNNHMVEKLEEGIKVIIGKELVFFPVFGLSLHFSKS